MSAVQKNKKKGKRKNKGPLFLATGKHCCRYKSILHSDFCLESFFPKKIFSVNSLLRNRSLLNSSSQYRTCSLFCEIKYHEIVLREILPLSLNSTGVVYSLWSFCPVQDPSLALQGECSPMQCNAASCQNPFAIVFMCRAANIRCIKFYLLARDVILTSRAYAMMSVSVCLSVCL